MRPLTAMIWVRGALAAAACEILLLGAFPAVPLGPYASRHRTPLFVELGTTGSHEPAVCKTSALKQRVQLVNGLVLAACASTPWAMSIPNSANNTKQHPCGSAGLLARCCERGLAMLVLSDSVLPLRRLAPTMGLGASGLSTELFAGRPCLPCTFALPFAYARFLLLIAALADNKNLNPL